MKPEVESSDSTPSLVTDAEVDDKASAARSVRGRRISLFFRWYDMWVGAYWDRGSRTLYVCPIPMFGIRVSVPERWFSRLFLRKP